MISGEGAFGNSRAAGKTGKLKETHGRSQRHVDSILIPRRLYGCSYQELSLILGQTYLLLIQLFQTLFVKIEFVKNVGA